MDQPFSSDDPTLGQAVAELDKQEAALGAETPGTDGQAAPAKPSESEDAAALAGNTETEVQAPAPTGEGTPATTDKPKPGEVKSEPGQSKFAKSQQRLEGGWKQLNEQKAQFSDREKALAAREAQITEKEQQAARKAQSNAKPPEHYDGESLKMENGALNLERQAEQAEAAGDFDKADGLRKQATKARVLADMAKEHAEYLRKNPPQTDKQAQDQFAAKQKEWGTKAAMDFKECFALDKDGKPANEATRLLQETLDPRSEGYNPIVAKFVGEHPEAMYHLAQFAKAKSDAASVPQLTRELATAHAEIKKLQLKLNVPIDMVAGGAQRTNKPVSQMTDQELEQSLRTELAANGQRSDWER